MTSPRARWAERQAAAKAAREAEDAKRWKDPFTKLERWFFNLPNRDLAEQCHCGSGKPTLWWSREEGTGCDDCKNSYQTYIPDAVMFNVMGKFGIPDDIKRKVCTQIEESRKAAT